MIKFTLACDQAHQFEAWFRDNADFDQQSKRGLVSCPICSSSKIGKALMAPSISTSRKQTDMAVVSDTDMQAKMVKMMREMAKHVKENAENVGTNFAEEARKIHYGEAEARGIYGQASYQETTALADEGIDFLPLPDLPDEDQLN